MRVAEDRLFRDLCAALVPGAGLEETGAALSGVIARLVAHDALRCCVMSPSLGMGVSGLGFWHEYGPDLGREVVSVGSMAGDRPGSLTALARQPVPVGVADRVRRVDAPDWLFAECGVGEELSFVLRDLRGVWGVLGLARAAGARPFDAGDRHRIAAAGSSLIAAVRSYVIAGPLVPPAQRPPAGLLVVGPDGKVKSWTPQARRWLDPMVERQAIPDWLFEACAATLAFEAREHARDPRARYPRVCVPSVGNGGWIAVEAQPLGDDGDVAILIQCATGALLLPTFCDWYQITTREQQIMHSLQDGSAAKQIARRLDLSVNTVNEHLKAIYRKTGACGRHDLIAAITA
ncbi:helix-turn-helix transcriptional regulator [Actinomadura fibrosa]|uniref:Helix-turn-helix transcriptional regulator n=1 Tax=Actinomadura fibrosa TaxID=111802 RepID=A0ABW2XH14_9ACTN|nr:helix-turn-helix transcriptional regulator [Actinomadura fibrosa]